MPYQLFSPTEGFGIRRAQARLAAEADTSPYSSMSDRFSPWAFRRLRRLTLLEGCGSQKDDETTNVVYCAVCDNDDIPTETAQSGREPEKGGGPSLSVGYPRRRRGCVGRAEPLRGSGCKGEGLPRQRSSAAAV